MTPIQLPPQVELWHRPDSLQRVTPQNIFDYMDGAGELYLGYRFDSLQVWEYTAENDYAILVEIYHMQSAEDAWGLLSLDWEGERIPAESSPLSSSPYALYAAGLLRLWAGPLYARVMAYYENETSRKAVLKLGEIIAAQAPAAQAPLLVQRLAPVRFDTPPRFFRSHLVLYSLYFLANRNILDLDTAVEGLFADAEGIRVLLLHYPEEARAAAAVKLFLESYLPDAPVRCGEFYPFESGQFASFNWGRYLLLLFDCPTMEAGSRLARQIEKCLFSGG